MNHETEKIPFNRPSLVGDELQYVQDAIRKNWNIAGNGIFTQQCQSLLEDLLNVPKAMLTSSCTHALEMAALLLDIQAGDEVIVPSFTFVSTVNAFVLRGAKPVFIDIRPDTLNMDEKRLKEALTPRTKAVVPVHYAGVGCEMDVIMDMANTHHIPVVEDNAHGLLGKYNGQMLGSFGVLATQSFHETKNFTCGEGGALLINDESLIERAEIIREKGTDRNRFFRGQVDKYTWVDIGSSYLLPDMMAGYLYAQLEARERIQAKRQRIWETYDNALKDWAAGCDVRLPIVPENCEQSYHLFYLLLPSLQIRQALIDHLNQHQINAVFHYLPLHLSKMGRQFGEYDCPITENVSDRLLRLPFFYDLTESQQAQVIDAIFAFKF